MSDFLSGLYPDALRPPKSRFYDPTATPAAYQPAPAPEPLSTPAAYQPPSGNVTAPNISASPTSPNLVRDIYAPQLNDVTQKLNAAYQAPRPGLARQIFGGIVTGMNPRNPLGGLISGETQRNQQIQPLVQQEDLLSKIIQANRQQSLSDAAINKDTAETDLYRAHADAFRNPPVRPKEEKWNVVPNVAGPNGEPLQQEENSGQIRVVPLAGASSTKQDKTPNEKEQAISDYLAGKKLPNTPANRDRARSVLATRDRPAKDPEVTDLNKQILQGRLEKLKEPTADEQRRADLADNMDENLTQLEEIARRRPELFGPLAGRLTSAKQYIGGSDPDVQALKNIEEQMGLAMVGAHAMRNAQHAEKAAMSVTNANKNTADVLLSPQGPIASARKSLQTFRADAGRRRAQIDAITGTTEPAATAKPAANVLPSFAEWDKQNK